MGRQADSYPLYHQGNLVDFLPGDSGFPKAQKRKLTVFLKDWLLSQSWHTAISYTLPMLEQITVPNSRCKEATEGCEYPEDPSSETISGD